MRRERVVRCPCCAAPTADSAARRPAWARMTACATVEWAQDAPDGPGESLSRPPAVGGHYLLLARHPVRAAPAPAFWAFFQPVLSHLNGWVEYPEELRASCLVRCELRAVVCQDLSSSVIRIRVRESLAVPDLTSQVAADSAGAAFGELAHLAPHACTERRVQWGDLLYCEGHMESDIGAWVVCQGSGEPQSVVLYGEWDAHHEVVYAGHRPLTARARDSAAVRRCVLMLTRLLAPGQRVVMAHRYLSS